MDVTPATPGGGEGATPVAPPHRAALFDRMSWHARARLVARLQELHRGDDAVWRCPGCGGWRYLGRPCRPCELIGL